jgi:hypothetical protein
MVRYLVVDWSLRSFFDLLQGLLLNLGVLDYHLYVRK